MTTYNVTNSNDSGEGSLRDAIALANANANEGLDLIDIQVENIELNSEIEISDSFELTGNGATITQIGEGQGIFYINDGNDETFLDNSFVDLTLTGANSAFIGGAISTSENIDIDNVYFLNNSGTGVGGALQIAVGTANISNSTFEGNTIVEDEEGNSLGAALFAEFGAVVNIDNSLFVGNSAERGAIETNQATLTITNSEVRNNSTRGIGLTDSRLNLNNVLVDNNQGQGIIVIGTDAVIKAATVANNLADYSGGIGVVGFDVSVSDSLIENNTATISGGAISSGDFANLEITHSIVTGNTAPVGAAMEAFEGGNIAVTDTYFADNVGENEFLGEEDITFAGANAENQNGVLPEGLIGYQTPEAAIGYQAEEAVVEEPAVTEDEVTEEALVEEPEVTEDEVTEEALVEEPEVTEDEVTEEALVEEPAVTEDEVTEEPVVVEPVSEKPVVEEPIDELIEEPVLQTLEITRSYQADTGVHMFTTGSQSIDGLEEQSFGLLSSDKDELTGETIEGAETIYQFLNSDTDAYLYTMDTNEVNYINADLDNYSLVDELYGFESEPQDIETIPIYRLLNTDSGTHMYVEGDELGTIQSEFDNFELEVKGEAAFYALDM